MLNTDLPRRLPVAFAADAGGSFRRVVPIDSQIGTTDGAASYEDGFVPLNATPVAGGGVPPSILDMNGALYDISGHARAHSAGQVFLRYDSAFSTAVGGYPAGAVLAAATAGDYWRSTANNNMTDPDSGGAANWAPFFPGSISKAVAADVTAGTDASKYITPTALRGASPRVFDPMAGYVVHPNGYIEQWGADFTAVTGEVSKTIAFPIEFPNACLGVSGTVRNTSGSTIGCTQVQEVSISTTGAVLFLQSDVHPYSDAAGGFRWRAFGF